MREKTSFSRVEVSEAEEPRKKFYLFYEGVVTEPMYFQGVKDNIKELGYNSIIEIIPIVRSGKEVGRSNIISIIEDVETVKKKYIIKNNEVMLNNGSGDQLWIIFDKDQIRESQYQTALNYAYSTQRNQNHHLGFTNALFEFWLLLHFDGAGEYDVKTQLQFSKINKEFIVNEVIKKSNGGLYKRGRKSTDCKYVDFDKFRDHIDKAVEQSKFFETNINNMFDLVGTNLGLLISELKK